MQLRHVRPAAGSFLLPDTEGFSPYLLCLCSLHKLLFRLLPYVRVLLLDFSGVIVWGLARAADYVCIWLRHAHLQESSSSLHLQSHLHHFASYIHTHTHTHHVCLCSLKSRLRRC